MIIKTKPLVLLLLTASLSYASAAEQTTSETEMCSSVASQYRYFDDAYRQGANFNPYTADRTTNSINAKAGIYNALLIASFADKTNVTKQAIDQDLIKLAYDNTRVGASPTFGQYYVLFNCMNVIRGTPQDYYHCDTFLNDGVSENSMQRFYDCAIK
jgi:hypothetical protein